MARDDIDKQKVLELREQGITQQSIADMFGCKRWQITQICGEYNSKQATEYKRVCQECSTLFMAGRRAKYCPECKKQKQREVKATENRTWKDMTRAKESGKKSTQGFVPAKCPDDCLYMHRLPSGGIPMCGFFLITGELRGCDPGKGCKRYVPMKNRTKHRGLTWNEAKGYEMYLKGFSDSEIAKAIKTRASNVKAYRLRVWEAEKNGR